MQLIRMEHIVLLVVCEYKLHGNRTQQFIPTRPKISTYKMYMCIICIVYYYLALQSFDIECT